MLDVALKSSPLKLQSPWRCSQLQGAVGYFPLEPTLMGCASGVRHVELPSSRNRAVQPNKTKNEMLLSQGIEACFWVHPTCLQRNGAGTVLRIVVVVSLPQHCGTGSAQYCGTDVWCEGALARDSRSPWRAALPCGEERAASPSSGVLVASVLSWSAGPPSLAAGDQ